MLDSPPGSPSSQDLSPGYPSVGIVFPPYSPSDPLPEYTRAWGTHLRRPDSLPPNYDTRIDPAHIFLFSVHPITGIKRDFYVTPKPCEYCAKIRQVCSRTRPLCQRCAVSGDSTRICSVEAGWVKLPGPKCEKPRLQKRTSDMKHPRPYSEPEDSPPPKKARHIAPNPGEMDGDSSSRTTPMPTPAPQVKKLPLKKGIQTKGDATEKAPIRRGKRWVGLEVEKTREDGRWIARDGATWSPIRPPQRPALPSKPKGFDRLLHDEPRKSTAHGKPRIWAMSQAELLEILPAASRALGPQGSSVYSDGTGIEPPLWFLDESAWPEDSLDEDGSASLSLREEILSPPQNYREPEDRTLRRRESEAIAPTKEVTLPPATAPVPSSKPPLRPPAQERVTPPCHPSQAMQSRQTVFRVELEPPAQPYLRLAPAHIDSSSSSQGLQVPTSNGSRFITFTRAPSKSPLPPPGPHIMPGITGRFNSRAEPPRPTLSRVGPPEIPAPVPPWDSRAQRAVVNDTFSGPIIRPCEFDERRRALYQRLPTSMESSTHKTRPPSSSGPGISQLRPAAFSPELSPTSDSSQDDDDIPPFSPDNRQRPLPSQNASSISYLQRNAYKPPLRVVTSDIPPITLHDRHNQRNGTASAEPDIVSPVSLPEEQPPEFRHLADCEKYKVPVALVAFRDCPLLPFALPADVGVAFLGLFRIVATECKVESSAVNADGWRITHARWHFKLRWIPGGENTQLPQPDRPWWQVQTPPARAEPSAYSILPVQLRTDFGRMPGELASEVTTTKGWHCTGCGRLNVQRLLCHQECESPGCKGVNSVLPVAAFYVRDPHRMTPDVRPTNTCPEGVAFDVLDGKANSYKTFVYTISEGVEIRHVFTCNRATLQKPFNKLFVDIQKEAKLTWQGARTRPASGPYFTYAVGTCLEDGEPIDRWEDAPESIKKARQSMLDNAHEHANMEALCIEHLTVLAWQTPGTRKGSGPLPCKERTVAIMCLGADVELTVVPASGYPFEPHSDRASGDGRRAAGRPSREEEDWSESDSEDDQPLAVSALANGKGKKARPSMFFTLVHGDMLLLSGDDFEYTIHRTGMSIVFFGMPIGPTSP